MAHAGHIFPAHDPSSRRRRSFVLHWAKTDVSNRFRGSSTGEFLNKTSMLQASEGLQENQQVSGSDRVFQRETVGLQERQREGALVEAEPEGQAPLPVLHGQLRLGRVLPHLHKGLQGLFAERSA